MDILLADDDEHLCDAIRKRLEACGHQVRLAHNGAHALDQVRERRPDLVIIDIIMPERDGIETIRELRRSYPDLKILAISGGGSFGDGGLFLGAAHSFGADATLLKPFGTARLLETLTRLTRLARPHTDPAYPSAKAFR